ncbi:MAG TPA: indolepyruvate oxidoreductase subunit beta [Bacillota bacterium]|jgi:indolepyruvate ferredoxin oxidoreductase beta subunit|nr:indolepyruvate oxidoreductase subunit beta [Peptococcaceae bacterium MAG4]NLW37413.1 indolepyruvate oxidoreductase subunit beta [Peptococcaceae bacterium]HPU36093.1 indolepyruvate oxidoreductase subunit beta [Bacillota bacterium]HPZ43999.1 indolepyruvate oxidoreductase subunit beta [Bacillota bacterium]HQD76665.1 indolepyruvate oxidoreductase subunit beta [Bacillota bacterium]
MNLDILISGVGGQGSVLASRALALAAMEQGLAVRTSEVIGMAQREGSVVSHVRIGEELYGAIIPDRRADFLLGLELAETARALNKLKPGGTVLASTTTIVPATVQLGLSTYDREAITDYIKKQAGKVFFLDLGVLSRRAGHPRTANVVILGALSTLPGLPFGPEQLLRAILRFVPEQFLDLNRRAFEIGRAAMEVA